MCDWLVNIFKTYAHSYVAQRSMSTDLAFSAAIVLILVYLPGHPPYYAAEATVVAKIYSNSMMAMLNSRIKPVSNAPDFSAPLWNEALQEN